MKTVIEHGNLFKLRCKDCGCVFLFEDVDFEIETIVLTNHIMISGGYRCPECMSLNNIRYGQIVINLNVAFTGTRDIRELTKIS